MKYSEDHYGSINHIGSSGIFYEQFNFNDTNGFHVIHIQHPEPKELFVIQRHCHQVMEVLYPQKNDLYVWIDGKEYNLKPKDIIFINPASVHAPGTPEGVTFDDSYVTFIDTEKISKLFPELENIYVSSEVIHNDSLIQKSLDDLISAYIINNDLQQKGSLLYLFGSLLEHEYVQPSKRQISMQIIQILKYIDENYANCELNPYTISEYMHMSYSTFNRIFKQNLRVSFKKYLTELRLRKVLEDLRFTNLKVTEIAFKNGFSDMQALNRACQNYYSISPGQYREQFKIKP